MAPLPPGALEHLLKTLPPEAPDPFPHLANLTPTALLKRRVEITGHLKTLEQERQAIDAELLEVFSDAELRTGIRLSGDLVLKRQSRTTWDYAPEIRNAIKDLQREAQRDGQAMPTTTHYLAVFNRRKSGVVLSMK